MPASRIDDDEFATIPTRVPLTVNVSRTASPKMKAWYRALLGKITEATGAWPNAQEAHRQLLIRCGFGESIVISQGGDVRITPPSTRDWDATDWRAYLDVLIPVLLEEHFAGIRRSHLLREIEHMVGIRFDEALRAE